ncbi:MAG TPA: polysaccharide pyruvyl transferase family protein, partial [Pirellulaceae bacterium]
TGLAATITAAIGSAADKRKPRILLRSSWQVVNIGDIAHTPGVLALIEKYIPEAEVVLWASADLTPEVAAMEHRRFPQLKIVKGKIGADGKASNAELGEAIEWADFLLHGSGASLVAESDVTAFVKKTGKPYGVYGITLPTRSSAATKPTPENVLARTIGVLSAAKFVYFRDSISLQLAKERGCTCPIMEFGPDGAFGCDLRDDEKATRFIAEHGLEEGKFLCCIARLRYSPYWKMKAGVAFDEVKHARNEAMKEQDLSPLREAIAAVVKETDLKVLLCPEDASQMEVNRENLYDKLPEDVKRRVVWRKDYWLTDEAISTYVRSAGLFGAEMHSPIMCIGHGIPAIVCRWAEQTSKGYMWRDIGLGDWLFDFDREEDRQRVVSTVVEMAKDPSGEKAKAERARQFVVQRQQETMNVLKKQLDGIQR